MVVVRRFSGGGTVYQDSGNLNFLNDVGKAVVASLKELGISAESNDISVYVEGKKICGLADTIMREAILIMAAYLLIQNLNQIEVKRNFILSHASKVTTIKNELGKEISI